jgi:hypothetical protein
MLFFKIENQFIRKLLLMKNKKKINSQSKEKKSVENFLITFIMLKICLYSVAESLARIL